METFLKWVEDIESTASIDGIAPEAIVLNMLLHSTLRFLKHPESKANMMHFDRAVTNCKKFMEERGYTYEVKY